MARLFAAIALSGLVLAAGFRLGLLTATSIELSDGATAHSSALSDIEFPAGGDCFLGSGLDPTKQSCLPVILEPVQPCADAHWDMVCKQVRAESHSEYYSRNVLNRDQQTRLINTAAGAEGRGFGMKVSISVRALQESEASSLAITFALGQAQHSKREWFENPGKMKMTDHALDVLRSDPESFVHMYGTRYVYKVVYGASFLGYVTVSATSAVNKSSLSLFANFSAKLGLFKASGSASFDKAKTEAAGSVDTKIDLKWQGGLDVVQKPLDSPQDLGDAFERWGSTSTSNTVPQKILTRSYLDIPEVAQIVHDWRQKGNSVVANLFDNRPIFEETVKFVTEEVARVTYLAPEVDIVRDWLPGSYSETRQKLDSLTLDLRHHLLTLQAMNEEAMRARQSELLQRNFSFFTARSFEDRLARIREELPECARDTDCNKGFACLLTNHSCVVAKPNFFVMRWISHLPIGRVEVRAFADRTQADAQFQSFVGGVYHTIETDSDFRELQYFGTRREYEVADFRAAWMMQFAKFFVMWHVNNGRVEGEGFADRTPADAKFQSLVGRYSTTVVDADCKQLQYFESRGSRTATVMIDFDVWCKWQRDHRAVVQ